MQFVSVDNYMIWSKLLEQKVFLPIETFELGSPERVPEILILEFWNGPL